MVERLGQKIGDGGTAAVAQVETMATLAGLDAQAAHHPERAAFPPDRCQRLPGDVAGKEDVVLQECAGIDGAVGRYRAGHARGAAHVQSQTAPVAGGDREEGVGGQDVRTTAEKQCKLLELILAETELVATLLSRRRPGGNGTGACRAPCSFASLSSRGISRKFRRVTTMLRLKRSNSAAGQKFDPCKYPPVAPLAPDAIVGFLAGAVQAHLDIEQIHPFQSLDQTAIEYGAVGADTGHDPLALGIFKDREEILPQEGFAAAEIDLKYFQPVQFIDQSRTLSQVELLRRRSFAGLRKGSGGKTGYRRR